jgi:hypothetical protein
VLELRKKSPKKPSFLTRGEKFPENAKKVHFFRKFVLFFPVGATLGAGNTKKPPKIPGGKKCPKFVNFGKFGEIWGNFGTKFRRKCPRGLFGYPAAQSVFYKIY